MKFKPRIYRINYLQIVIFLFLALTAVGCAAQKKHGMVPCPCEKRKR